MSLALEIEYLTGVCYAATATDRSVAEWPPHPDRVFSALVCAWGDRRDAEPAEVAAAEEAALRWLSTLDPPRIACANGYRRQVADVYVPPNDMTVSGRPGEPPPKTDTLRTALAVLPPLRRNRQARQFPAVVPAHPRVRLDWPEAAGEGWDRHGTALQRLAHHVPSLGHSASLVRMRFAPRIACDKDWTTFEVAPQGGPCRWRTVHANRFDELATGYAAARAPAPSSTPSPAEPPRRGPGRKSAPPPPRAWRPPLAPVVAYRPADRPDNAVAPAPTASCIGEDWVVFADAGGHCPALEAFPIVADAAHKALLSWAEPAFARIRPEPTAEDVAAALRLIGGHEAGGAPAREPHVAILPLADVGWEHSAGRLMGLAVALPREVETARRSPLRRLALAAVGAFAGLPDGGPAALTLGRHGVWSLERQAQPTLRSLLAERYIGPSRRWATVLPMVLDRHPKPRAGEDIGAVIAAACRNIGLPQPVGIAEYKHPAPRGAPSSRPPRGAPAGAGIRLPAGSPLVGRPLRHVVVTFPHEVRGPVVLGAGRFRGLGLCLPIRGGGPAGEVAP